MVKQEVGTERAKEVNLAEVLGKGVELQTKVVALMVSVLGNVEARRLIDVYRLITNALDVIDVKAAAIAEANSLRVLMEKYKIEVLGDCQVSLNLAGTSRIEFLNEVQGMARELHERDAICPQRLQEWSADPKFTAKLSKDAPAIQIDGNVKGSTNMTRSEQEQFLKRQGLSMSTIEDLAVAHAAYFIATGKDLFAGNLVRASGDALDFIHNGLAVDYYSDAFRFRRVAAAAYLPSRNPE